MTGIRLPDADPRDVLRLAAGGRELRVDRGDMAGQAPITYTISSTYRILRAGLDEDERAKGR